MNCKDLNATMQEAFHGKGYTGKGACIHLPGTMAANGYDDYPHDIYMAQMFKEWCPDAIIRPMDVFEDNSTMYYIKQAMRDILAYAIAHPEYMHFVNMSFVWNGYDSEAHELIKSLVNANVAVFAAAGNDGKEDPYYYPSHYEEPICVAALNEDGTKADFSTFHDEMDFAEWGVNIPCMDTSGNTVPISGTSIATPIVLAKGVLLAEQYNAMHGAKPTEPQIYQLLLDSATDIGVAGKDPETGYGFVEIKLTEEGEAMFEVIKKGDKGDRVKELQTILVSLEYDTDGIDSDFGSLTEAAVKDYQSKRGLTVTGIVDEATWNALQDEEVPPAFEPAGLMKTFIQYLMDQAANHGIYVWGAQGQTGSTINEEWIRDHETSDTNAQRAIAYWKKQVSAGYGDVLRAFDCSGLGMYFIQNLYGLASDLSAQGMRGLGKEISRADLRAGDWVLRVSSGKAYHIGYVVDNALHVIHAKGRDAGVVREELDTNGSTYWNLYIRPTVFDDVVDDTPAESEPNEPDTTLPALYAYTGSSYVNVRSGPGTTYDKLGKLSAGESCIVLAISGDWAEIIKHNDKPMLRGWCSAKYIKRAEG